MQVHDHPLGFFTLNAERTGNGVYSVSIPTAPSDPSFGNQIGEVCKRIEDIVSLGCPVEEQLLFYAPLICPALAAAISTYATPAVATAIYSSCMAGFAGYSLYCKTLGVGPPGGPSGGNLICQNLAEVVDLFTEEPLFLSPIAIVPGVGIVVGAGQAVPGSGPFPNFTIEAGGPVDILSFTTSPVDPAPFESYLAIASIVCAPPGTTVTISIVGTDGYQDSAVCNVEGNSTCHLLVPGGEAGIVDTVTIQVSGGPSRQIVLVF